MILSVPVEEAFDRVHRIQEYGYVQITSTLSGPSKVRIYLVYGYSALVTVRAHSN